MPNKERKRVPDDGTNALKGSLSHGPLAHPQNTEDLRLSKESEVSRDEATQRSMDELYKRQCGSR